jgi:CRP-like cAMP-binding protein
VPDLDAAVLAERALQLVRTPLFASGLLPEQLEALAAAGREVAYARRTVVVPEGQRPAALYVALAGRLRALRGGEPVPGDPVGPFFGGLGIPASYGSVADIVAEPGTILFILDEDAVRSMLEETSSLGRLMLQLASTRLLDLRASQPSPSGGSVRIEAARTESLDVVGRMLLIRDALDLPSRNLAVLAQLARAASVRHEAAGKALVDGGSTPSDLWVVVQGTVQLCHQGGAPPSMAPAGRAVGLVEAVAGKPMSCPVTAVTDVTSLIIRNAELHEAIEDHDEFCMDLLSAIGFELQRRTFPFAFANA